MHDSLSRPLLPNFLGRIAQHMAFEPAPRVRQFVVQHLYPDTLRLLLTSAEYYPLDVVISIAYSGDAQVISALKKRGVRVLTPTSEEQPRIIREALADSIKRAEADGCKLMIHEVGGAALCCVHEHFAYKMHCFIGAVEITNQGVWAAQNLPELTLPQLNCAQTRLKEIEGDQVGEAVVAAADNILRAHGRAIAGRQCLVTGFGWVGRGVARSLKGRAAIVTVKEPDPIRRVAAQLEGYLLYSGLDSLSGMSLVLGAAGRCSLDAPLLAALPDKVVVGSASSKQVEIDLFHLEAEAQRNGGIEQVPPHLTAYPRANGSNLYLLNQGFPVNFTGASVPDEVVEFLFGEALVLMNELVRGDYSPGTWPLSPELEAVVAEVWLAGRL